MFMDGLIDQRHQWLPVRAAVQRTEENRHLRCVLIVAACRRQLHQLVFKEIDMRVELPQLIHQILRGGLYRRDSTK